MSSNLYRTRGSASKRATSGGSSPRLSAKATQLRKNVAAVARHCRHCADFTGLRIEFQTSRTDSVRLTTELTDQLKELVTNLFWSGQAASGETLYSFIMFLFVLVDSHV